jgi:hypothetical protein
MKKLILLSCILIIGFSAIGQNTGIRTEKSTQNKIRAIPYQTEQAKLSNGFIKIEFKDSLKDNYVVMLTPVGSSCNLYVAEKMPTYFIVKGDANPDCRFDYFVFLIPKKEEPNR